MDNSKQKTFKIDLSKIRSNSSVTKKVNLENHVELDQKCLKYFLGCWIKYINKEENYVNSGGFLTELGLCNNKGVPDWISLRTLKSSELLIVEISMSLTFYVKTGTPQYTSMCNIISQSERHTIETKRLATERLQIDKEKFLFEKEKQLFEAERLGFDKVKDKFYSLVLQGRAKIL